MERRQAASDLTTLTTGQTSSGQTGQTRPAATHHTGQTRAPRPLTVPRGVPGFGHNASAGSLPTIQSGGTEEAPNSSNGKPPTNGSNTPPGISPHRAAGKDTARSHQAMVGWEPSHDEHDEASRFPGFPITRLLGEPPTLLGRTASQDSGYGRLGTPDMSAGGVRETAERETRVPSVVKIKGMLRTPSKTKGKAFKFKAGETSMFNMPDMFDMPETKTNTKANSKAFQFKPGDTSMFNMPDMFDMPNS
ncbi:hypothetical protein T484DRAFT_2017996 [Baffinella frigidus]|nr:hypothetical protein T484DRAFT_2017996 [Cryptophyta sp. CCMP2293]